MKVVSELLHQPTSAIMNCSNRVPQQVRLAIVLHKRTKHSQPLSQCQTVFGLESSYRTATEQRLGGREIAQLYVKILRISRILRTMNVTEMSLRAGWRNQTNGAGVHKDASRMDRQPV